MVKIFALFESNWISWFKKMSVLSRSYQESDVYWRQNNKHFAEWRKTADMKKLRHCHPMYKVAPMRRTSTIRMWANAQRDGRPAEHRWRLCSTPQSLADAHY